MVVGKEIWKEYPLNYTFENSYRIEISNFGRIKTYHSKYPKGNLVKGSLQGGYPILRVKLFKAKTPKQIEKLENIKKQIETIRINIKEIQQTKSTLNDEMQLNDLEVKYTKIKKNFSDQNRKINNQRTINLAILTHRAVAELFLPKPDENQKLVIHKDFDKKNNTVENLQWATQDTVSKRFNNHPKVILRKFKQQFEEEKIVKRKPIKLTDTDVLYIKERLRKKHTLRSIAKQFNVSDMQIHRIKTGENWGHIKTVSELKEQK